MIPVLRFQTDVFTYVLTILPISIKYFVKIFFRKMSIYFNAGNKLIVVLW
jgi:hypothetical protein